MHEKIIILVSLTFIAFVFMCRRSQSKNPVAPAKFAHLIGWQKIFGLIAIILALMIIMNPDFLALGLMGDTAFFDLLVVALSVQMLLYVQRVWRGLCLAWTKSSRWLRVPSPGLRYTLALFTVVIGSVTTSVQKVVHRIIS
ncbi:MAG TPA: hypothetical protein VGO57_15255 [Verrucomicrobiae bacterium]|jgi:hypothetical protein